MNSEVMLVELRLEIMLVALHDYSIKTAQRVSPNQQVYVPSESVW